MSKNNLSDNPLLKRVVTAISPDRVELLFTLVLVLFMGTLLWQTFGYEDFGKIIPLIVATPTFVFLLVILAAAISPRVNEMLNEYQVRDIIDVDEIEQFTQESEDSESDVYDQRLEFIGITLWIIIFGLLFHYVGAVESITIVLLGYYRITAKQNVVRTVLYTGITLLFIYLVFDMVLEMRLFTDSWFAFLLP
ncbi:tripartite tricarboxylate transporter TctB family protein [Halobellus captivus]|uniref:tripartite tricarboxylate transporter TctB family protein n=1 Tax=Halobellus captivus TaxID=2592614 RepID=UPI00139675F0|nr:tripartite tricarboxylate transporter TctB family protein [Halobellus captivus]